LEFEIWGNLFEKNKVAMNNEPFEDSDVLVPLENGEFL